MSVRDDDEDRDDLEEAEAEETVSDRLRLDDEDDDVTGVYDKQDDAPWAPNPTWIATKWIKKNPTAVLGVIFPSLQEEDRTRKLQDLGFAAGMDFISHRRAAEQSSTELGFEDYDYNEEMNAIAKEKQQSFLQLSLGAADALAQKMLKLPQSAATGEPGGARAPLAGANKAKFRKAQKDPGT